MTMIRRLLVLAGLLPLIFLMAGCNPATPKTPPLHSIKTYKDIPGVTAEEIAAIESLKAAKGKFSYGSLLSSEAFPLSDDSYGGFTGKYCKLLSELFGVEFAFEIHEWDDLMANLDSGTIDFTGELTATEERRRNYLLTSPIAERLLRIFMHVDSDEIRTEADAAGHKIGFLEGSITADSIRKAYPKPFTQVDVADHATAAKMISSGEIDAFVEEATADPIFAKYDFIRSAIFFPMVHEPVSMMAANHELAPVIAVVDKYIAAGGLDRLYDIYQEGEFEYAKYKLHQSFTVGEKTWLDDLKRRNAPILVAYERDNYPVNFYNEKEKEFAGIAVDVLKEIGRLLDVRFEIGNTDAALWADMYEKTKSGEIPMVAQLLQSEVRKEHFIWSAIPYSHSYYAIMSKADFPNLVGYQVKRHTVGAVGKSGHIDIYRELFSDTRNLREYDSFEQCLDALEKGEVELLMASEHMLITQTHYREKPGFKINIKLNVSMDSYFGFHKDEEILCSIISKAQQYVPTEEIETIWMGKAFDYSKKLAEDRAFYLTLFAGVVSLILLMTLVLLVKNIRLSRALREIACKDSLTDIYNRRYFTELGRMQTERVHRTDSANFIVLFDLDHFKHINDTYGHLVGDKVLKEAARQVKSMIRPYDLFARYGGEEFIILMPDIDAINVMSVVERIRQELCKSPVEYDGKKITISASFGIACAAPHSEMSMAIQHADMALYRAKEEGRNRTIFYEE